MVRSDLRGRVLLVSGDRKDGEVPSAKRVGFVQTYNEKPCRRLWELLKWQGMQETSQWFSWSDDGEVVRRVQQYLRPFSEHRIDWFTSPCG
jgi:hypothetical protein